MLTEAYLNQTAGEIASLQSVPASTILASSTSAGWLASNITVTFPAIEAVASKLSFTIKGMGYGDEDGNGEFYEVTKGVLSKSVEGWSIGAVYQKDKKITSMANDSNQLVVFQQENGAWYMSTAEAVADSAVGPFYLKCVPEQTTGGLTSLKSVPKKTCMRTVPAAEGTWKVDTKISMTFP